MKALTEAKKLCLLDRDGVLNVDKDYLYQAEDVEWISGSLEAVAWLNRQGYRVVVVTNQSGVARGYFTEDVVKKLHDWMAEEVKKAGGEISAFYYCPHLPGAVVKQYDVMCECRKPKPGMFLHAAADWQIDPAQSYMIGDRMSDLHAAKSAGCAGGVLVLTGYGPNCAEEARSEGWPVCPSVLDAVEYLLKN